MGAGQLGSSRLESIVTFGFELFEDRFINSDHVTKLTEKVFDCTPGYQLYDDSQYERMTIMRRTRLLSGSICLLAIGSFCLCANGKCAKTKSTGLVQMERDFARSAATKGTRDAFLEFIADDGILFQPAPINGKSSGPSASPARAC
jgi:hypothetical protein